MVRVKENINQREQVNINPRGINIVQQKRERKELLNYMITLLNIFLENAGMCGLRLENSEWEDYYRKMKMELLNKYQQLIRNYRQSELENDNYSDLVLVLTELRKDIQMIGSNSTTKYYQKIALTTCQHLLEWES